MDHTEAAARWASRMGVSTSAARKRGSCYMRRSLSRPSCWRCRIGFPNIAGPFFFDVPYAIWTACCSVCVHSCRNETKLFRNVPANVYEVRLALAGLPQDMKVIAGYETGISESTVEELCARTTWPPDLVITAP